ncbi:hypothetical protein [Amycolatopsis sp. NPDC049159]|uniref:hypothetical protein n=1 Tax=Amycolatopsis sp. NPDC049159 TaxID=3157210 RepID=UPI0033DB6A96
MRLVRVLASLLPGLREVRTPIAGGFAWLLAVADPLPESRPLQRAFAALWDLGAYVGKVACWSWCRSRPTWSRAFLEVDPLHLWEHGGLFRQGVRCAIRSREIIVQAVVAEVVTSRFLGSLGQPDNGEPAPA